MSQQGRSESENKLHSDRYEAFVDALETLYIRGNLSARIQFTRDWPAAAQFVFGEELIGFDTAGTPDRDRRSVLEDEAETRRLELCGLADTLEDRSVNKGALQIEYVDPLVKRLGRELSLLLYSPRIVDRFLPPSPPPAAAARDDAARRPITPPSSPATAVSPRAPQMPEAAVVPPRLESMDHIQPISLAPPPSSAPALPESLPATSEPLFTTPPVIEESAPVVKPFAPQEDSQIVKPISIPKFEDLKKKPEGEGQP